MSKKNERRKSIEFDTKIDGQDVKLRVRLPNLKEQQEGQKHYNRAFSDAVKSGALLRAKLDDFMEEQEIWSEAKQKELSELNAETLTKEQILAKGGIKISQAKEIALSLKSLRHRLRNLVSERMDLDVHTAEGQADNARFNYWVSACLVYNDSNKPVFSSLDDYLENSGTQHASDGAAKMAELVYNLSSDFEGSLEENMFLKEFGFVNEDNRLVNEKGQLVNENGHLIDDDGNLINENGERVDYEGNLIDENGRYKFDRKPFVDDDGNPIVPKSDESEPEPKKAGRPKKKDTEVISG